MNDKFKQTMDDYNRLKSSIEILESLLDTALDTSTKLMIEQSLRIQKDVLEQLKLK